MSLSHQKFREIVFQLLYSQDIGHPENDLMLELMMNELAVSKKNVRLAQEKVNKILENRAKIDSLISSVSTSYDIDRIQMVTKNILRLGVYELFLDPQTPRIPPKAVISEAIRLSRKFNTPESASFVNALLDQLYQQSLGVKVDQEVLSKEIDALNESEEKQAKAHLEKRDFPLDQDEDTND